MRGGWVLVQASGAGGVEAGRKSNAGSVGGAAAGDGIGDCTGSCLGIQVSKWAAWLRFQLASRV